MSAPQPTQRQMVGDCDLTSMFTGYLHALGAPRHARHYSRPPILRRDRFAGIDERCRGAS